MEGSPHAHEGRGERCAGGSGATAGNVVGKECGSWADAENGMRCDAKGARHTRCRALPRTV